MITVHAVGVGQPLLIGRLIMHRAGRVKGRPVLAVATWCAWCRLEHRLDWPDAPFLMDAAIPSRLPCDRGPFAGVEVMVGLDPARRAEHHGLIRDHAQALRRWRVEQRLRQQLAVSRSEDRAYRREGWDVR